MMANKIIRICKNELPVSKIVTNARKQVEEFDSTVIAAKWKQLICDVVDGENRQI